MLHELCIPRFSSDVDWLLSSLHLSFQKGNKHSIWLRCIKEDITSYHVLFNHILFHHIISYHIISYHIIPYHTKPYHTTSYYIISQEWRSCYYNSDALLSYTCNNNTCCVFRRKFKRKNKAILKVMHLSRCERFKCHHLESIDNLYLIQRTQTLWSMLTNKTYLGQSIKNRYLFLFQVLLACSHPINRNVANTKFI